MGKKYADALKLIEADKFYSPKEAVALVKKTAATKFDSTVEVAFRLGVNPKYPDQQVRGADPEGSATRVGRRSGVGGNRLSTAATASHSRRGPHRCCRLSNGAGQHARWRIHLAP